MLRDLFAFGLGSAVLAGRKKLLPISLLVLSACSLFDESNPIEDKTSPTITTKYSVLLDSVVGFDSLVVDIIVDSQIVNHLVKFPSDMDSVNKALTWEVVAAQSKTVKVQSKVYRAGYITHVQDGFFVSGQEPKLESMIVYHDYRSFTDERDGQVYQYILIGNQTWMTQNLNYLPPGKKNIGAWCYEHLEENCGKYGRLYDWQTAMNGSHSSESEPSSVRGVCPTGWHLPSVAEWKTLISLLGGTDASVVKVKAKEWGGDNFSGFSALPTGLMWTTGHFDEIGLATCFWTSVGEEGRTYAYYAKAFYLTKGAVDFWENMMQKTDGLSVRCIKD